MSGPESSGVILCWLYTTEPGRKLVYFEPQCDQGRAWIGERIGVPAGSVRGIYVSCDRTALRTHSNVRECHASHMAENLTLAEFRLVLSAQPLHGALEPAPDAVGLYYRSNGPIGERLYGAKR